MGFGLQVEAREVAARELREGSGGDHHGVVGGELWFREVHGIVEAARSGFGAEPAIASDAAGDDEGAGVDRVRGAGGAAKEFIDDGLLESGEQVEGRLRSDREPLVDGGMRMLLTKLAAGGDLGGEVAGFSPAEDGGLPAGEAEVLGAAFDAGDRELVGEHARVSVRSELIDDGSAGIAEAEELGNFVVSFAGGIVASAAEEAVAPAFADFEEVGVSTADDESQGREVAAGIHDGGVDVSFEMIDADEGLGGDEAEGFGVGESDEEGANESGSFGDGDGVEIRESALGAIERFANNRHDGAEMFAGGEFGYDAAVLAVSVELRGDDGAQDVAAVGNDRRGGFVTRGFDAKNQGQIAILAGEPLLP